MSQTLHIEVTDSIAGISAEQWNALCQDGNPFLCHEFLHALESCNCLGERTGWYPRFFLLWRSSTDDVSSTDQRSDADTSDICHSKELIGAVPAYLKTNSYGEFVFDWAWAEAYERHQMNYYPKLVSSIPFTPATGRRLLIRDDQPEKDSVLLLASALRQYAESQQLSSVHYLFMSEAENDILCAESPASILADDPDSESEAECDSEHNTAYLKDSASMRADNHLQRFDVQYHWHNNDYSDFSDFLAQCTSKRRKTIRRERRYVSDAGLRLERRLGSTLSEQEWRWVHQFYCATFDRKWGNPSLTRKFFESVGQTMGEKVLIVFAYDPLDKSPEWPVACSVMFIGRSTLYGRYWGCRADYNALHFEACYYQGIDYCIENNIRVFEPGAQGEHKITRGFVPTITRSAHYIEHPQFREAIADFLSRETPHVKERCKGLNDLLPFKQDSLSI
jgi:predicted N-acyltransferase